MKRLIISIAAVAMSIGTSWANIYSISSPDKRIVVEVQTDSRLTYRVVVDGAAVTDWCQADIELSDGTSVGEGVKSNKPVYETISEDITAPFYRQKQFHFQANTMTLKLNGGFSVKFLASDQGVAYRFESYIKRPYIIKSETAAFSFADEKKAYLAYTTNDKKPFAMAFQNYYDETTIADAQDKIAFLPATVDCGAAKITITESDLEAYPGMFLKKDGEHTLRGTFAPYPKQMAYYPWRKMSYVESTEDYIAKADGKRAFPWRIMAVATDDRQMPTNDMVYALASSNRTGDTEWIETGKVAWDWWNDWNIEGVDFESGINMATYKYYIDFAAKNHLQYIILDEGWYNPTVGDMLSTIDAIDLPELIGYAKERGVRIVLWTVFNVLDEQLEAACKKYSDMGIAGFKVDFLDRDDQTAVEMAYRIAAKCAQYHLTLDFHGFYKPTGMNRTFPNITNYESVFGMEEMKWSDPTVDMPHYDVTFPYIRMMAGMVDYTPGAMRNAKRENWRAVYSEPMSMGTRSHQVAAYIVHDSPFTMLADAPSNYDKEQETVDFISAIPTVFDKSRVVDGKIGEYIVMLRQKGDQYYMAGQTDWRERDITIKFDQLPEGTYSMTIFKDGVNANKKAEDYAIETVDVDKSTQMTIHLAPGGGFAAIIKK